MSWRFIWWFIAEWLVEGICMLLVWAPTMLLEHVLNHRLARKIKDYGADDDAEDAEGEDGEGLHSSSFKLSDAALEGLTQVEQIELLCLEFHERIDQILAEATDAQ